MWVERGLLKGWKTEGGHRRITAESVIRLKERRLMEGPVLSSSAALEGPAPPVALELTERLKVLVIEDDKTLMRLYKLVLGNFPLPIDLVTAPNAVEGLLLLGRESPDLLITDILMPGLDGYTMVKILCQSPFREGLEIIIVSGTPLGKETSLPDLPSDIRILPKPVPFPEIQRICEGLLRERRAQLQG
jgi:CheY-like chemotaxis protein